MAVSSWLWQRGKISVSVGFAQTFLSGRGLFLIIIIPRKRSLSLFSSSYMKLSEGWISFSVHKNTEADETSGILLRLLSTKGEQKAAILFWLFNFSSIWHINAFFISGPKESPWQPYPLARTNFLQIGKRCFFFVMLRAYLVFKPLSSNAFSAWISMLHQPLFSSQR